MGAEQDIGERFLDALLHRDFAGLGDHLHPRVQLRALQPGGALVRMGAGPVAERCQSWFGAWDRFTVLARSTAVIGTRLRLTYHVAVSTDGDLREVAHQMFVDVVDDRIGVIDLLDSGFVPAPQAAPATGPTSVHERNPVMAPPLTTAAAHVVDPALGTR